MKLNELSSSEEFQGWTYLVSILINMLYSLYLNKMTSRAARKDSEGHISPSAHLTTLPQILSPFLYLCEMLLDKLAYFL